MNKQQKCGAAGIEIRLSIVDHNLSLLHSFNVKLITAAELHMAIGFATATLQLVLA